MATLVVIDGASRGNHLKLPLAPVIVGRDERCDMQVLDEKASREHMRIEPTENGDHFMLEDISANGVAINGARISHPVRLNDNDLIVVGATTLVFTLRDIDDRSGAISFAAHGEHLKSTLEP